MSEETNTYFSLVPDDVWYYMLMNTKPLPLLELRRTCPYLMKQSLRPVFGRDYFARWGESMLKEEFYYGLVVCRVREVMANLYRGPTPINICITLAFDLEDPLSLDWILDNFGIPFIESQPPVHQQPLIEKMLQRGISHDKLCQKQSTCVAMMIQDLYPEEDYTGWCCDELNGYEPFVIDRLKRKVKYDPQKILLRCLDQTRPLVLKYLLSVHSFEDDFLYLMTTQTRKVECLTLLLKPAVIDQAIQAQDLQLVFRMLTNKIQKHPSSLYSFEHAPFIARILQLNNYLPTYRQLTPTILDRLQSCLSA